VYDKARDCELRWRGGGRGGDWPLFDADSMHTHTAEHEQRRQNAALGGTMQLDGLRHTREQREKGRVGRLVQARRCWVGLSLSLGGGEGARRLTHGCVATACEEGLVRHRTGC